VTLKATDAGSTLVGGAGDDLLIAGHNSDSLTGGPGSDVFQFNYLPWNAGHITDFTSGVDHIDINALFTLANYHGTNPIADGYLSFASDGAGGTKIYFDVDGPAPGNPWPTLITTLDHVTSSNPMDWFVH